MSPSSILYNRSRPKHIARYVFFWRAMIQYCYEMTITPNNRARDRNYEVDYFDALIFM